MIDVRIEPTRNCEWAVIIEWPMGGRAIAVHEEWAEAVSWLAGQLSDTPGSVVRGMMALA